MKNYQKYRSGIDSYAYFHNAILKYLKLFVQPHIIMPIKIRERTNENVRIYFGPRSSKDMGHFRKTGTKAMRRKHISGVAKFSFMWLIPKDAEKPMDKRKNGKTVQAMNSKILLVDDEKDISDLIEEALRQDSFADIQKAYTGLDAIQICREYQPDVIILDIMLPDIDGIEVCKKIREFSICSILFLSSRNDDIDKILGLSSGGDDYITKPFSPREIVYRVKAQLRRQQYQFDRSADLNSLLTVGFLALDKESCRIYKKGQEIELTGREFLLLSYLMENADKIISKERLYEQVWGEYSSICDNTIMVHIRHIREKIEDTPSAPKQLITIKGLGYKLKKRTD